MEGIVTVVFRGKKHKVGVSVHKLKQIPLHNVFKVKIGHFGAGKKSELPSVTWLWKWIELLTKKLSL